MKMINNLLISTWMVYTTAKQLAPGSPGVNPTPLATRERNREG